MMKDLHIDETNEDIQLHLWDTAGQEIYATITRQYYRGAGGCALAFSTTDRESFEAIESWKAKVEEVVSPPPVMVLVQTKCDLIDQAVVTPEEAEALARRLGLSFFRVSTKQKLNVDKVFTHLAKTWLSNVASGSLDENAEAQAQTIDKNKPKGSGKEGFGEAKTAKVTLNADGEGKGTSKQRAKSKKRKCIIL
eukprot:TRINITY_DN359_c1_g1_i2.p1 TRINITY_DN359_c1_g1~~TRINITY_DN359_c1_g1_i2.p1  ORF type:complete len:194 (+),score=82.65 TRINITY_DN359_c1_g1_i2:113-694(+)